MNSKKADGNLSHLEVEFPAGVEEENFSDESEIVRGNLYDYPKYYDLVFGDDWQAEFDFLRQVFDKHGERKTKRLFEPACGTGRLMIKLVEAGYEVAGNDLNPHAVKFCNNRLKRRGFPESAVVGDMADFRVPKKFDAAFNMINSFRHLDSEEAAENHLRCVANALAKGGLYVLGLHLTPTRGNPVERESWAARRGNLSIVSDLLSVDLDRKTRNEHLEMTFYISTPTRHFRLCDTMNYRTYTAKQFEKLLSEVPELSVVETYDFVYDIDDPVRIGPRTEDVVFILRKN